MYSGGGDLATAQSVLQSYGYRLPTADGLEVMSAANGSVNVRLQLQGRARERIAPPRR